MLKLAELIQREESWLVRRVLGYAKQHGYTAYTSTLEEAWRLSISGLSASIVSSLEHFARVPELEVDTDYSGDPSTAFGVVEARRHRERGVSLTMFLGLYKYYLQTYLDLISNADLTAEEKDFYSLAVTRVFDRIEIAFCKEWTGHEEAHFLRELQESTRRITNEKNVYLTVFESLLSPVILLDDQDRIRNINYQAARLIDKSSVPGSTYYSSAENSPPSKEGEAEHGNPADRVRDKKLEEVFPFLSEAVSQSADLDVQAQKFECTCVCAEVSYIFEANISKMLDVSEKFLGTLIILTDITERKANEKKLEILAKTDPLTQTNNRRYFFELADKEFLQARRYSRKLSVIIFDIDHFKQINDTYGHQMGDEALKKVTHACKSTLRSSDTLGRIGGEEFAVLLPETSEQDAVDAAERIRAAICAIPLTHHQHSLGVTASFGVASRLTSDTSLESIIARADQALYQAKSAGRNYVMHLPDLGLVMDKPLASLGKMKTV